MSFWLQLTHEKLWLCNWLGLLLLPESPADAMVSFYYVGKLLIQLLLFVLFLLFFGLPSYHRYHQKGVLVKTEKTSMQGLELPAVTICPRGFSKWLTCGANDFQNDSLVDQIIWVISLRGPGASGWRSGKVESTFWDVLRHQCSEYSVDNTEVFQLLKSKNQITSENTALHPRDHLQPHRVGGGRLAREPGPPNRRKTKPDAWRTLAARLHADLVPNKTLQWFSWMIWHY